MQFKGGFRLSDGMLHFGSAFIKDITKQKAGICKWKAHGCLLGWGMNDVVHIITLAEDCKI